jgi:iron complex outermembrane receptor protein
LNGKIAGRYQLADGVAVRAAASTGFRAPTVGQEHASSTALSPDFTNPGEIITQTQLPTTDQQAVALGAKPLKPEESVNLSAGIVFRPTAHALLTLDGYDIDIRNRLSISQLFQPAPLFRYTYFVNGYRTRTDGADLVATYEAPLSRGQSMTIMASGNYNSTKVISFTPGDIAPVQITALERKLPHWTNILRATYSIGPWLITGRLRYYSSLVDIFADLPQAEQRVPSITFFDLSTDYDIDSHWKLTLAAEDLFDTHPQRALYGGPLTNGNRFDFGRMYPSNLPYDFDGGRYYVRVSASY